MPQAEHMPHVMPRARSSKSSGRVRQIKQRSEVQGCGCGCWCSGAVWVDGWAAFARVSGCRLCVFNVCAAAGEAWMLALREHPCEVCVGVLMANIVRCLQFWARIGCPLRLVVSETTAFKFLDPLSGIATYPSGALRLSLIHISEPTRP